MPAGDALTEPERHEIDNAVRTAGAVSGLSFSVHVGHADSDLRAFAERQHAGLPEPASSVLVVVDPAVRGLEIVTGVEARRVLSDDDCRLAALTMTSTFAAGDLAGGIGYGIQQLGERARRPNSLHADET